MIYDIVIIGAGPAGLTAAIYGRRAGKSVLVLEKDTFGGQVTFSPKLENYPGFQEISGNELAQRMLEQAMALGAEIDLDCVTDVLDGETKTIVGENGKYEAKSVIIAAGAHHRRLHLPKEEDFIGNGIYFCAVCDGAFFKDQHVAVIGGGNTALQEVVLLSDICRKVTVVQNLAFLTGEDSLMQTLRSKENIDYIYNTVVSSYEGEDSLSAITLHNTETGADSRLEIDGIFLAIGTIPENEPFSKVSTINEQGYILSDENASTGTAGIFVAGDCRTKTYRQVATAIADGAAAALNACRYLDAQ